MTISTNFAEIPLAKILRECRRKSELKMDNEYTLLGIRNYGQGLFVREKKKGSEIRAQFLYQVHKGDFVYSRLSASSGGFALALNEHHLCYVSNEYPCFEINLDLVEPKYLKWYFYNKSAWRKMQNFSYGTGRMRLNVSDVLTFRITIPSLSIQRRIVAKVENLAAKVEEARRLRNQSFNESEALGHSISRKVFQDTDKFRVVQLKDVCSEIIDCLHSNPIYSELGIPTVRSPDVGWGRLFLKSAKKTSEQEYRRRTSRGEPKPGDIILVREGGGTGKAGIVEEGQRLSLGQRVMQLQPKKEKVLPRFLLHQWLSPLIQEDQIGEMMKGSASPHLNIGSLKKFNFILPPIEEQRHIVAYLDRLQAKVEKLKQLQAQTAAELDALLPSILDKAFKGEL